MPPDLASALDDDADARQAFDQLSYSKKRWHVLSAAGAKTDETRRRRIERSLQLLEDPAAP